MKDISQRAERRGINRLIILGGNCLRRARRRSVRAGLDRISAPFDRARHAGIERTQQQQGQSRAGTGSEPSAATSYNSGNPQTTGRGETIAGTGQGSLVLSPQQIDAIKSFAAGKPRVQNPNFTVAVGVAVPRQVQLHDLPPQLSQGLPSPEADGYFLAENQFVIVEKQTRRVVAIVPVS
jgi:Protein of unknown function (DUF1236)